MTGFNSDIIERLVIDSQLQTLKEFEKNVTLVYDEMKIKADLVDTKPLINIKKLPLQTWN